MNKLFLPLLAIIFFFGCAKEEAALTDAEKQQEFQLDQSLYVWDFKSPELEKIPLDEIDFRNSYPANDVVSRMSNPNSLANGYINSQGGTEVHFSAVQNQGGILRSRVCNWKY